MNKLYVENCEVSHGAMATHPCGMTAVVEKGNAPQGAAVVAAVSARPLWRVAATERTYW